MGLVPMLGYIRCLLEKERKPLMEGNDDRDKPGPPVALTLPPFLSLLFSFLFFSDPPPLFYLVDIAEKKEIWDLVYTIASDEHQGGGRARCGKLRPDCWADPYRSRLHYITKFKLF